MTIFKGVILPAVVTAIVVYLVTGVVAAGVVARNKSSVYSLV